MLRGYSRPPTVRNPPTASDRVRHLDVAPLEVEALGEMRGERLDAEALGRVVAGCDQVDAELARRRPARLLRLAGQQRVEALVRRPDEVVTRAARRDRKAPDLPVSAGEDERRALDRRGDPFRRAPRARGARSCTRAPPTRTAPPVSPRSAPRAARCSRAPDARRAPGGTRRARRFRGRAPRGAREAGRRRRAARSARTARGGRAPAPRRGPPRARRARASTRRRTRSSSPRTRRRPEGLAGRTPGSARSRGARSRARRSRPWLPRRESTRTGKPLPFRGSGCGAAW